MCCSKDVTEMMKCIVGLIKLALNRHQNVKSRYGPGVRTQVQCVQAYQINRNFKVRSCYAVIPAGCPAAPGNCEAWKFVRFSGNRLHF